MQTRTTCKYPRTSLSAAAQRDCLSCEGTRRWARSRYTAVSWRSRSRISRKVVLQLLNSQRLTDTFCPPAPRIHRESNRPRPSVAGSHLANTQDGTTCQGSPWAPDTAPLWSRLDFVADHWDLRGQTVCCCKLLCILQKTQLGCSAPHLCFTCLNPSKDRESREADRGRLFQV